MGNGIAGLLAKSRLRLQGMAGKESAVDATTSQLSNAVMNPSPSLRSSPPPSVTEGTTRHLDGVVEKSKRVQSDDES